jgi:hypothetical protein
MQQQLPLSLIIALVGVGLTLFGQCVALIIMSIKIGRYTGNTDAVLKQLVKGQDQGAAELKTHVASDQQHFEMLTANINAVQVTVAGLRPQQ